MQERSYLENTLYDYFADILKDLGINLQIVYESENGVRPVPPFLSIGFNSATMLGTTPYFKPRMQETGENTYIETSVQQVERSVTMRGFGASTEDVLNSIRDLLQFDAYVNKLASKSIVIKNVDSVTEASNNLSEDEETFYAMDFVVAYGRKTQLENEYIGGVNISTQGLDKPAGDKTQPVDINI